MAEAIVTNRLTKRYGELAALDGLDLMVRKGEILGYLGPNGSGKTTTIRLLLGMITPTTGSASIFGLDVQTQQAAVHRQVAYVPGEANLWPFLTGYETLELLANVHGSVDKPYRDELIRRFALEPHKKVRAYSKGNKQKVALIAALATRAELLILDEPTSGLDPLMEQAFREAVREAKANGQTVFLSSHILEEVEALCDRVAVLRAGKLVEQGTLEQLRHLSAVTVTATFAGKPPAVGHIAGVDNVTMHKNRLTCQVHGSIDPLLGALAKAHPVQLLSTEPSLEELFLSLYGDAEAR
ncbi:MAG TPA: ABC transporter ATP-binding protein [Candidatus Saccharimonadales bacterium]|nr:ABC transporter ATP-binding protein [Candidatus Saccharimonadales bacterium]